MKSRITIPHKVRRACGHTELQDIKYLDTKERRLELKHSRSIICHECSKSLLDTMSKVNQETMPLSINLCELQGSPSQIKWATSIRNNVAKTALPIMSVLNKRADSLGNACLLGMYLVLMQNQSSIWISHRDMEFNLKYFIRNTGYFTDYRRYAPLFDGRAVKGHIFKHDPERSRMILSRIVN